MKTKLIIANWLFAWVPLCYVGDDPFVAMCIVGWFGFSSYLLNRNKEATTREIIKFEEWIDKQINN